MYSIGDLSRRTGVKVPTIRYYENIGLFAPVGRTRGNQRRYDLDGLRRLKFIRHARELGLPIEAVRALVALDGHTDVSCDRAHDIAKAHLADIRVRISQLQRLEAELARISALDDHDGGPCMVLEALGDHETCTRPH
ncbi:helix-turn-helix domain-containing protein [Octadecabacter sp. 1_MG-2023]|uniref:MerR family transcriptional regulator n=1 Tax=unclassified Octadecabacter TaxID=196158 RepID=UPI001C08FBC3|nr:MULTISPECIES: helix-turn-helix domain-containing protein [unclassified Octadecabacter]MBU2992530.1 helix-turn-helix domain-containing protein [Octadecabacter sp. B2R22]MDO6734713.1 helix-turn-helix domain-containing protein [Octadecabacter sp. 1_MG-2023]